MAPDAGRLLIGAHHHRHGIPADNRLDAPLQLPISRVKGLLIARNGIDIGRIGGKGDAHPLFLGTHLQQAQQLLNPLRAGAL